MFNFFNKKKNLENNNNNLIISIASLLIHTAKIDQDYSDKEREIIKKTLINLGVKNSDVDNIIKVAEKYEKNSNQILDFTKQIKNLNEKEKKNIIESLWKIIYADKNSDMYENNLMRRLTGLMYLDNKTVGDIKEKVKSTFS